MRRLTITALLVIISAAAASAIDTAIVTITRKDKPAEVQTVKLDNVGNDVWRLKIPTCKIPRDARKIDVLLDWAVAKKGEPGYFITPDANLISFREDEGSYNARKAQVKMYGAKTPRGTFVGIVKGLPLEFTTQVEVKNGEYKMFPRFNIDKIDFDPYEDIVIDFHKLEGGDADYSGMARAYRKYQLDRGEVVPLAERVKGNPTLDFTAKTIYVRIKLGRCDRRAYPKELWGKADFPLVVDHDFNGVQDIMKRMKGLDVDWAEVCLVGWHKGGHDGPFPDLFPVPQEFGGEAKMVETVKLGKELGYRMTVHINQTSYYLKSKRLDIADVAKDSKGEPAKYVFWPGGQAYQSCFETVCNRYVDDDIAKFKEIGINGTFHVDVTTAKPPGVCHDPRHPNNRKEMAEWQNKVNQKLRDAFGGYSSECAMDHVAKTLDYGLYVTWEGADAKSKLVDRPIPLVELVYHGIILTNPFYGTIDAPYERGEDKLSDVKESYAYLGCAANRRLKVTEFGGRPSFYYVDYKDLGPLKDMYDEYQQLKYLQFEFMDSHSEIAPRVYLTKYSDGSRVVSNYNETPYSYEGETVKPKGYLLYKGKDAKPSVSRSY